MNAFLAHTAVAWYVTRAAGLVAFGLLTLSVWLGLGMSTRLLGSKMEFALTASGHIAGVINPASKNRRNYWLNSALASDAEDWLGAAASRPGSWWTHWSSWIAPHAGSNVAARAIPEGGRYQAIEAAPGRYVKEKCG